MKKFRSLVVVLLVVSVFFGAALVTSCDQSSKKTDSKKHSRDRDDDEDETEETEETEEPTEISFETEPTETEPVFTTETAVSESSSETENPERPERPTKEPTVSPTEPDKPAPTVDLNGFDPMYVVVSYDPNDYIPADSRISVSHLRISLTGDAEEEYSKLADSLEHYSDLFDYEWADMNVSSIFYGYDYAQAYQEIYVKRADPLVFSFVTNDIALGYTYDDETYRSTVTEYFQMTGVNFDSKSGQPITLDEVFDDIDGLYDLLIRSFDGIESANDIELLLRNNVLSWVMEPKGVVFMYNYANGEVRDLSVLYYEYAHLYSDKYFNAPDSYVVNITDALESGNEYVFDADGDKVADTLKVTTFSEYDDVIEGAYVYFDGNECKTDNMYCYSYTAYLVKEGDKCYLILDVTSDNDYHSSFFYELTPGEVRQTADVPGSITGDYTYIPNPYYSDYNRFTEIMTTCEFVSAARMYLCSRTHILSTYDTLYTIKIGEDGAPYKTSDLGVAMMWVTTISARKDFHADDYVTGEKDVIVPAGTELKIIFANSDTCEVVLEDVATSKRYLVKVDQSDWPWSVDGMPEDEVFSQLFYAG